MPVRNPRLDAEATYDETAVRGDREVAVAPPWLPEPRTTGHVELRRAADLASA
jgi:hypothetical protein